MKRVGWGTPAKISTVGVVQGYFKQCCIGSDASPLRSGMSVENVWAGVVMSWEATCRVWVKAEKQNAVERGTGKLEVLLQTRTKPVLQGGVTREIAESFTHLVAWMCHPYDRTRLRTRSELVGSVVREKHTTVAGSVKPPSECPCATRRVMYCVGTRHGQRRNALRTACSRH